MAQILIQTNEVAVGIEVKYDVEFHAMLKELYSMDYPEEPEPILGAAIVFNEEKEGQAAGVPVGVLFHADVEGTDLEIARQGLVVTFGLLKKLKRSLEEETLDEDNFYDMICGKYERCTVAMFQLTDEKMFPAERLVVH